ncbi:GNAT family N-acetyltransferase [Tissierella carlieri]|uniref:GNAT family N-acetyltransferase n=1 Tax=Tissierella carlieri TaxID=689904 RepID=UPI001C1269DD|nr:GNAT family N-acetyltransferase [Tissierella carlieri]MBU5311192.1 GNAT family N-acetyltransferase [Tissierella carlieri]
MREIRQLNEEHIDAYTDIAFNAYPSFKNLEKDAVEKYKKIAVEIMTNDPDVTFYGMFEGEKLIAVMRLFDFRMNCFGKILPVSGIGFLGVHLMHKKEKCAKTMIEFYEEIYKKKGTPIGMLLPFRPDFYKRMGYGMGTKMNQYRLPPDRIPAYFGKSDLRYVEKEDFDKLFDCHSRVVAKKHGMIMKIGDEIRDLKNDPYNKIIGNYDEKGNINGYLVFKFQNAKDGNYTINNIYIKELIYENTDVLKKLLGFLRKQDDQVNLVVFNTEDENFHYLFDNPLNDSLNYIPYGYIESNTQAVGAMYKLFDIKQAFEQCSHRNYNNSNLKVRFLVYDELNNKEIEIVVNFIDGIVNTDSEKFDVTMRTNMANFSSLFLGSTSVIGMYNLGLLELDNVEFLEDIDRTFYCSQKPVCYTDF